MDARLQRRIQRYGWDKAVRYYEQSWQSQLEPAQSLMLEMADLNAGDRVLDTACGTGLVTFRAAKTVGGTGFVFGTDISDGMVQTATEAAENRGFQNVAFQQMDAEKLKCDPEEFDAALCALGMMYYPDPVQSLRELHRTLKSGAQASAAVWGRRSYCGWAEIFPIVDARVETDVCPLFFQLGAGNSLRFAFEQAGFGQIEQERISTKLVYDSAEEASMAVFAGGPVALAYERFDEQTRAETHEEYLDSIAPYRSGDGYEVPGEFVVVRGRKT